MGSDEAYAVVTGLARIAQEAKEEAGVHPCPHGGETTLRSTSAAEMRGDTTVTSSRWEFVPNECRFGPGREGIMVSGKPNVVFTSEVSVSKGGSLLMATVGGGVFWRAGKVGESCPFNLMVETAETVADGVFTGTLTAPDRSWTCGGADRVAIPLSDLGLLQP